ncbi:MAG: protease pro-enzyme activation domain-containing protein [Terracidiphilus sp.]
MSRACFTSVHAPSLVVLALSLGLATIAPAESHNPRITEAVDNSRLIVLAGNTRPEATAANDRGPVDDATPMNALQLVLQRSPENEAAFDRLIADLHNPKSASFHKWLTNAQIGAEFGPTHQDVTTTREWLASQGFKVNSVSPDRMVIEFSGTAGMVRSAFHTPLHNLSVNGVMHFANMHDPALPAALAPVVAGIAKLNDFRPHALNHLHASSKLANVHREGNAGGGDNYLGAADLAEIYNFNPLFKAGITGKGQTIVLIEDTNQYSVGDWTTFRKVLGLSRAYPYATLTQVNPTGTNTCGNPGVSLNSGRGDDVEAAIDVEWASAAAPNAAIVNAACADTTQFGGFLALANLLQEAHPPTVVSISYGESEASDGASENLYINDLYQSAAAEGVSVFVSSGDEDAASSDNGNVSTHGITVSGFTSTPYNISVGGTDFGVAFLGETSSYFSSTNGANFQTALSYVSEVPWNDSCAGILVATYIGLPTTGTDSLCNYDGGALAEEFGLLNAIGGSGGPSACATGTPATRGVANGTCAGYAKPAWQSVYGNPADGVRDIPDVSLFASNGFWGFYYAVCISDPTGDSGFTPCTTNPATWAGYGGTSVSSPIWAGIQALVNQKTGSSWGNSNTVLYSLASTEYGASGNASCNSTLGNAIGSSCLFNDVTLGDNLAACDAARSGAVTDCYINGGRYGILSTSDSAADPAYSTDVGWDFATGIGTANAANIVNAWP